MMGVGGGCGGGGGVAMMGANLYVPQALPQMLPQMMPQVYQGAQGGLLPMQTQGGLLPMQGQGGLLPMQGQGGLLPMQGQGGAQPAEGEAPAATADDSPQVVDSAALAADGSRSSLIYGHTSAPTAAPGCPWRCIIDETVPTHGGSNEDDAIYEIFYTNPLHCCGTIVEIGAEDGVLRSPSYFFERGMNWTSILTEANPTLYSEIRKNRLRSKVTHYNGAFCEKGPYIYYDLESHTFGTTTGKEEASEVLDESFKMSSTSTRVNCIRLDHILSGVSHVNVMVVRVKGDPWSVIRTMDWDISVDIWVIMMETRSGLSHESLRTTLMFHDYVPAAWDIKLWCQNPDYCKENEVWLKKGFNPLHKPMLGHLRGTNQENTYA